MEKTSQPSLTSATKDLECQLAQGQIGRYINGDRFSTEAVKQLEAHIAECPECSAMLAQRREEVIARLSLNAKAVVETEETPSAAATAAVKLLKALTTGDRIQKAVVAQEVATPERPNLVKTIASKPVLYCTALALVLLGMSYFSRGATKFFGPSASQALPADAPVSSPKPAPTVKPAPTARVAPVTAPVSNVVSKPKETPALTHAPAPVVKPKATPAKKAETKPKVAKTPKISAMKARHLPRAAKPRVRIAVHRLTRHPARGRFRATPRFNAYRATAHAHTGGVRVYDASGHPIR
jgi:hypothetical protein